MMQNKTDVLSINNLEISVSSDHPQPSLVRDVNLQLRQQETLGIVGESGSGKSLTLRAIADLLKPGLEITGGTIELYGNRVGVIFQEPLTALNPTMRVWKLITLAPSRAKSWSNRRAKQEAISLLKEVGIEDAENKAEAWPHELSGGLRQRVMIAMALANEPNILLCDEPTTAVDVLVQSQILKLLQTIRDARGLSVIFVSHDLAVIRHLCERVAVMRNGNIVETGETSQVFTKPAEVYTNALIESMPRIDTDKSKELATVESVTTGTIPIDVSMYSGSGFLGLPLEVRDLSVAYKQPSLFRRTPDNVVHNVSLSVEAGKTLGLVGASGSGKSTVARAVAGLQPVTSGTINIGDQVMEFPRKREHARTVQMVFQDPAAALNPMRTVQQTLEELLIVHRISQRVDVGDRVIELLQMVGLSARFRKARAHELSGGQKQRVGIAKALALEPKVLIADESVAALDVSVQASVINTLRRLQGELGLTMLFISHDLSVTRFVSDEIAVMNYGRIVEHGPAEQIIHDPAEEYTRRLLAASQLQE